jgi:hypothetical protein
MDCTRTRPTLNGQGWSEYFDEAGTFHYHEWDEKAGTISRSKRFDPRNSRGKLLSVYPGSLEDYLSYSTIVLDAVKDRAPGSTR